MSVKHLVINTHRMALVNFPKNDYCNLGFENHKLFLNQSLQKSTSFHQSWAAWKFVS